MILVYLPIKEYKIQCGQFIGTQNEGHGCIRWRFPLRGGNYNNGAAAGLGALNLNNRRANVSSNIGFRPALPLSQKPVLYGGPVSVEGKRSRVPSPLCGEYINRHGWLVGNKPNTAHAAF
jgi:hypothetical protein